MKFLNFKINNSKKNSGKTNSKLTKSLFHRVGIESNIYSLYLSVFSKFPTKCTHCLLMSEKINAFLCEIAPAHIY